MKKANSVLITGGSGYIGSKTIQVLIESASKPQNIFSVDVRSVPEAQKQKGVTYIESDVRSQKIHKIIAEHKIDTVVHLASIVTPGKKSDREFEYSVDVGGTKNILEACVANKVSQIVITSSGAAYGYYQNNPAWIKETHELRGNPEFAYSDHKRQIEEMLALYRRQYPKLQQLIFRPGTILGQGVNNQITALFEKPFIIDVKNSDSRFVIIWDMDVAHCIAQGIAQRRKGIYNLAGSGTLNMSQIAEILGKKRIVVPAWLLRSILRFLKLFHLSPYGPEQVKFLQYRPVLSNKKLIEEFGYVPQKTTREVFEYYLSHRQ